MAAAAGGACLWWPNNFIQEWASPEPANGGLAYSLHMCFSYAMVRVGYVGVPPDLEQGFRKHVVPLTKTVNSSMRKNTRPTPRRRRGEIAGRSYLPALRALWQSMTELERSAWEDAAPYDARHAWHYFVSDTSARWKAGLEGAATPSIYHSGRVGHVVIGGDATSLVIQQVHVLTHKRMQRVVGSKSQQVPTLVQEVVTMPFTIGFSYRSNLTAAGPEPYARLYADLTVASRGTNKSQKVACDLSLVSEWESCEQTLAELVGVPRNYSLVLELRDCTGVIEFDYVRAEHSGTNFAFDFRCDDIAGGFNNANYQLPAAWTAVEVPEGAGFYSTYPSDSGL